MHTPNAPTLDTRAIDDLVTRVDANLPVEGGRVLGFMASGRGEGTSTVVAAYVASVARNLHRKVLCLTLAESGSAEQGVLQALAAGQPIDTLLRPLPGGGHKAVLGLRADEASLRALAARADLWAALRGRFDEVVLDLPASSDSSLGLAIAPSCDGVVVVLEAERSRAPVVENLVAGLRAVRARVVGTVLNKRQFHLPERIYRWL